jgi:hypothetical protein
MFEGNVSSAIKEFHRKMSREKKNKTLTRFSVQISLVSAMIVYPWQNLR